MDSRGCLWLGTRNNPLNNVTEYLERLKGYKDATYVCGQLEKGAENGTPHIQFVVSFKKTKRLAALRKFDGAAHWEIARGGERAITYCMKEETRVEGPYEFGVRPIKRDEKKDWDIVRKNAEEGKFESIPSDIFIRHYSNLRRIASEHVQPVDQLSCRGIWVYGAPGVGKSHAAREAFGDIFIKAQSKWWDGYQH
jgi:DNA replication protein DnaC